MTTLHIPKSSVERTIESMGLTLAAAKSLQAEYLQRAIQAEQMVATLMAAKQESLQRELTQLFVNHIEQRSNDRSVHQNAVLQATVLAMASVIRILSLPEDNTLDPKASSDADGAVNKVDRAIRMLQHIQSEIDRCLNVDEEVLRIRREAQSQSVNM